MSRSSVDLWVQDANSGEDTGYAEGQPQNDPNPEQSPPNNGEMSQEYSAQFSEYAQNNDGYNENNREYDGLRESQGTYGSALPDILLLAHFCAEALPPNGESEQAIRESDQTWGPVREWMRTHSAEEVHAGTLQRDDAGKTALHLACQNSPPDDVVDVFMSIAAETAQWPDSFGWLPIHYACAYAASTHVIKCLAEAYPESKTTIDRKGRTPLHFALGTTNAHSAAIVVILSSTGAASYQDDNGMLPLHYACAYGASEDCLYVLTDAFVDAIGYMDQKGRTPLHFTLSNAGRPAASSAVRLLLGLNRDLVNSKPGSPLPLRVLAEYATTVPFHQKKERESCRTCLRHLLGANPVPTADFFTALKSLPDFLQELAVVMKVVQELLNFKISQRFCTLILFLDFYMQMLVVTYYSLAVLESIDLRFKDNLDDPKVDMELLYPLYVGTTYFFLREVINFLSLLSLGALSSWAYEPSTWLNIVYIFAMYFWTISMTTGGGGRDKFRIGAAVSIIFIWTKFLSYLRNMMIEFAVFTGGVFHVMRRLAAFLICLIVILVAFSRMFYTLYATTDDCINNPTDLLTEDEILTELQCATYETNPWCDSWDAFLAVYTMLLGEVDETKFAGNRTATILFVLFMFLVVILLANVLIAIVTDSYKVIQDERAAIVFWTNRLNFIAQMDAIANGPWKKIFREMLGMRDPEKELIETGGSTAWGKDYWKRLMEMFEEDIDASVFSVEYITSTLLRLSALFFIIPAWIVLGIATFGWLWPPQIREYVFTSAVSKHNSESEREEELRRNQLVKVQAEIVVMGEELRQELALDRTQIAQTKSLVAERKQEIQAEMKHIKRVVAMLFEQQTGM